MCYVCSVVAMAIAAQELVLEVLQALTSNTQIVKETMQKGIQQPPSNYNILLELFPFLLRISYQLLNCGTVYPQTLLHVQI